MTSNYQIKFADGTVYDCVAQPVSAKKTIRGGLREVLEIRLSETYQNIRSCFVDNASFCILAYEELTNVSGLPSREYGYVEYPKEGYVVAGDIIDYRDGTMCVIMGKKTQLELLEEENAALLFENLTGEAF